MLVAGACTALRYAQLCAKLCAVRPIDRAKSRAQKARQAAGVRSELSRIQAVQLRRPPDELALEVGSVETTLELRTRPGAPPLWPLQAWALRELFQYDQLAAPVGVGGGKTWIAALAPTVLEAQRAIILTKPSLVRSTEAEIDKLRAWYPMLPPDRLRVVSYNIISAQKTADTLRRFEPDVVIADEAHCLRDLESNRTRRVLSFVISRRAAGQRCVFIPMSGTMTEGSVFDYMHLYALALGDDCPLPADSTLDVWGSVLDAKSAPSSNDKIALRSLLRHGQPATVKTLRAAYRRRVKWTPGIVASEEGALTTGLEIYKIDRVGVPAVGKVVRELRSTGELPDGTEIVEELDFTRHARTLSLGFWNSRLPAPGTPAEHVEEWQAARRAWNGSVNWALSTWAATRPGYDSKGLLAKRAADGQLDAGLTKRYTTWLELRDSIEWISEVKWVTTRPVEIVVESFKRRARDGRGVIWYRSSTALEPVFEQLGIPVFGKGSRQPMGRDGVVAAQLDVHGTGWNAQHEFADSFAIEVPSSASLWEQFVGRMHRPGQVRDDVRCYVAQWSPELRRALATAIEHAKYIEETKGTKMKLCYATFAPAVL